METSGYTTVVDMVQSSIATALGLPLSSVIVKSVTIASLHVVFEVARDSSFPITDTAITAILSQNAVYQPLMNLFTEITGEPSQGLSEPLVLTTVATAVPSTAATCNRLCIILIVSGAAAVVIGSLVGFACYVRHRKKLSDRDDVAFKNEFGCRQRREPFAQDFVDEVCGPPIERCDSETLEDPWGRSVVSSPASCDGSQASKYLSTSRRSEPFSSVRSDESSRDESDSEDPFSVRKALERSPSISCPHVEPFGDDDHCTSTLSHSSSGKSMRRAVSEPFDDGPQLSYDIKRKRSRSRSKRMLPSSFAIMNEPSMEMVYSPAVKFSEPFGELYDSDDFPSPRDVDAKLSRRSTGCVVVECEPLFPPMEPRDEAREADVAVSNITRESPRDDSIVPVVCEDETNPPQPDAVGPSESPVAFGVESAASFRGSDFKRDGPCSNEEYLQQQQQEASIMGRFSRHRRQARVTFEDALFDDCISLTPQPPVVSMYDRRRSSSQASVSIPSIEEGCEGSSNSASTIRSFLRKLSVFGGAETVPPRGERSAPVRYLPAPTRRLQSSEMHDSAPPPSPTSHHHGIAPPTVHFTRMRTKQ